MTTTAPGLPQTILVTGARAPVALHLLRLLASAGHRVHLVDSLAGPLAGRSRLHEGCHRIPSPRFDRAGCAQALRDLITRHDTGLVIPTCEEIFHLSAIWAAAEMPCPLLAPAPGTLARAHHKGWFIEDCAAFGLAVPETLLLESRAAVQALTSRAGDLVFKPAWSRFADQVLLRPRAADLAKIAPSPEAPWIAQSFVTGQEISLCALAIGGRLMALSPYRALARAGVGASIAFAPVQEARIEAFVQRYVQATGWTGLISFDLMCTAQGAVLPLECNPRATSGLHFFGNGPAFTAALSGRNPPLSPDLTGPAGSKLAVALFGLRRPLASLRLIRAMQDIHHWPGDDLRLIDQLRGFHGILRTARGRRISLAAASTWDIEWNGPDDPGLK